MGHFHESTPETCFPHFDFAIPFPWTQNYHGFWDISKKSVEIHFLHKIAPLQQGKKCFTRSSASLGYASESGRTRFWTGARNHPQLHGTCSARPISFEFENHLRGQNLFNGGEKVN